MSSSAGESDRESSLGESESLATERVSNSQEENQNRQNYAQVSKIFYSTIQISITILIVTHRCTHPIIGFTNMIGSFLKLPIKYFQGVKLVK